MFCWIFKYFYIWNNFHKTLNNTILLKNFYSSYTRNINKIYLQLKENNADCYCVQYKIFKLIEIQKSICRFSFQKYIYVLKQTRRIFFRLFELILMRYVKTSITFKNRSFSEVNAEKRVACIQNIVHKIFPIYSYMNGKTNKNDWKCFFEVKVMYSILLY